MPPPLPPPVSPSATAERHLLITAALSLLLVTLIIMSAAANSTTVHSGTSQQGNRSAMLIYIIMAECAGLAVLAAMEASRALAAATAPGATNASYYGRRASDIVAVLLGVLRVHIPASILTALALASTFFVVVSEKGTSAGELVLWFATLLVALAAVFFTLRGTLTAAALAMPLLPTIAARRLVCSGALVALAVHGFLLGSGFAGAMRRPDKIYGAYLFLSLSVSVGALWIGSFAAWSLVQANGGAKLPVETLRLALLILGVCALGAAVFAVALTFFIVSLHGSDGNEQWYPDFRSTRDNAAIAAPFVLQVFVMAGLASFAFRLRGKTIHWVISMDSGAPHADGFVGVGALEKGKTKRLARLAFNEDADEALLLDDDRVGALA